jgi:hypothetical protein
MQLDEQSQQAEKAGSPKIVETRPRLSELALAFGIAWLVLVLLIPHITHWLNPVTGDEPFYLMTAQSLLADGDLDETNNYNQKDYWKFSPSCEELMTPGWGTNVFNPGFPAPGLRACPEPYDRLSVDLPPHFSKEVIQTGNYTKHGLGLSFLILPAYALGQITGIRVTVVLFLTALAALLGVNIWLLVWETVRSKKVAWLVWAALTFTTPVFIYAFLIFPSIPAALCLLYAFRRIRLASQGYTNYPAQAFLTGLCIGFLPWLHAIYLLVSAALFAYWLLGSLGYVKDRSAYMRRFIENWGKPGLVLFFIPLVSQAILFVSYYLYFYGRLQPNEQDHAGFVGIDKLGTGVLGLLLDQKWGLLPYAPLYLLALAGMALLIPRRLSDFIWLLVIILPYFSFIARYAQWWGEWCPPARYLTPVLPLLALPLAAALERVRHPVTWVLCGLSAFWSFLISIGFAINPKLFYHWQDDKPARLLTFLQEKVDLLKPFNLASWFPSYVTELAPNKGLDNTPVQILWFTGYMLVAIVFLLSLKLPRLNFFKKST